MRILIVEDDSDIAMLLKRGFEMEDYQVDCAGSGEEATALLAQNVYEAMILDIMLPRRSGLEVCHDIRNAGFDLTVIMLSARDAVADRIEGLSAGADDYVVKPFEFSELLARVKAQKRRADGHMAVPDHQIRVAEGVMFDPQIRKLESAQSSVLLTERETDLLMLFIDSIGKPVSRIQIFEALWADDGGNAINVVDVYIGYLRRKFETIGVNAKSIIKTVRGKGYLMDSR